VDPPALPHRLTEGEVDGDGLGIPIARDAEALLGGPDAVLLIDERAFAQKGEASAGVARQWNGRLGQVDQGQVGVFAGLCREKLATRIDAHRDVPASWAEEPGRCRRAAIPRFARHAQPKSTLARTWVDPALRRGVRFGPVGADAGYGKAPAFRRGLDALGGRFVVDVHRDPLLYPQAPELRGHEWTGRGPRPHRLKARTAPRRVDPGAAGQPPEAWQRLTWRGGERGPLSAEHLQARVWGGRVPKPRPKAGLGWFAGKWAPPTAPLTAGPTPPLTPLGRHWRGFTPHGSSSSPAVARPRASVAWPIVQSVVGMPGITPWRGSGGARCSW
jgi:hypothetical protein